jgi:hypothetical protein
MLIVLFKYRHPTYLSLLIFRRSRGFVTFVKSNAKALSTLRIESALRSARLYAPKWPRP